MPKRMASVVTVAHIISVPNAWRIVLDNTTSEIRIRHGGIVEAISANARVDTEVRKDGIATGEVIAAVLERAIRVPSPGTDSNRADAAWDSIAPISQS